MTSIIRTSFQFLTRPLFRLSSSSDFERYYFYNSATDKASWDYPTANPSTDQQKDSPALSTASSAASRDVSVSPPTTPPPGVDSAASPPPVKEEWQGPPPPPPPLEEGEIPPSPPTPPIVEGPEFKDEDEECEADESYQLESGPLLYYGPSAPPSGVLPAEQEVCVCVCACVCARVGLCTRVRVW